METRAGATATARRLTTDDVEGGPESRQDKRKDRCGLWQVGRKDSDVFNSLIRRLPSTHSRYWQKQSKAPS